MFDWGEMNCANGITLNDSLGGRCFQSLGVRF